MYLPIMRLARSSAVIWFRISWLAFAYCVLWALTHTMANSSASTATPSIVSESEYIPDPPTAFNPGIYQVIGLATRNHAMDVTVRQNERFVTHAPSQDFDNQKWEFISSGPGYHIRFLQSGNYLNHPSSSLSNGCRLTDTEFPVTWSVDFDNTLGLAQIRWPNSSLYMNMTLSNEFVSLQQGSQTGDLNVQQWFKLTKLGPLPQRTQTSEIVGQASNGASDPGAIRKTRIRETTKITTVTTITEIV